MASTDPTNVVSAYQVILLALASCGPSTSKSKQQINRASSNQIAVSMYLIDWYGLPVWRRSGEALH
jgi:hypothetical protein